MSDTNDLSQFTTEVLKGLFTRLLWFSEVRLYIDKTADAGPFMVFPQEPVNVYPGQPVRIFNMDPVGTHSVAIENDGVFGCKEIRDIPAKGSVTIAARLDSPLGPAGKISLVDDGTGGGPVIVTMNPPGGGP